MLNFIIKHTNVKVLLKISVIQFNNISLHHNNKQIQIMKATILKSFLFLSILFLIILGLSKAPKGNDYIQYEREIIESGQMNINNSEYFIKADGVLRLK
jgi:hypothetical protein